MGESHDCRTTGRALRTARPDVSESPCPSLRRTGVMSDPCELLFIAPHRRNVSWSRPNLQSIQPMSLRDIFENKPSARLSSGSVSGLSGEGILQLLSQYEKELWFLTLGAMLMDVTLTVHGLQLGLRELNPVARVALDSVGVLGLYGLKGTALLLGIICVSVIPGKYTPLVPLGLAIPSVAAVLINTVVISVAIL